VVLIANYTYIRVVSICLIRPPSGLTKSGLKLIFIVRPNNNKVRCIVLVLIGNKYVILVVITVELYFTIKLTFLQPSTPCRIKY